MIRRKIKLQKKDINVMILQKKNKSKSKISRKLNKKEKEKRLGSLTHT